MNSNRIILTALFILCPVFSIYCGIAGNVEKNSDYQALQQEQISNNSNAESSKQEKEKSTTPLSFKNNNSKESKTAQFLKYLQRQLRSLRKSAADNIFAVVGLAATGYLTLSGERTKAYQAPLPKKDNNVGLPPLRPAPTNTPLPPIPSPIPIAQPSVTLIAPVIRVPPAIISDSFAEIAALVDNWDEAYSADPYPLYNQTDPQPHEKVLKHSAPSVVTMLQELKDLIERREGDFACEHLADPNAALLKAVNTCRDIILAVENKVHNSNGLFGGLFGSTNCNPNIDSVQDKIMESILLAQAAIRQDADVNHMVQSFAGRGMHTYPLFMYAIRQGCPSAMIRVLLEKADTHLLDGKERSAYWAWYNYYYRIMQVYTRCFGHTQDAVAILQMLLERKTPCIGYDSSKRTLLCAITQYSHHHFEPVRKCEHLQRFIDAGANIGFNISERDNSGKTALHYLDVRPDNPQLGKTLFAIARFLVNRGIKCNPATPFDNMTSLSSNILMALLVKRDKTEQALSACFCPKRKEGQPAEKASVCYMPAVIVQTIKDYTSWENSTSANGQKEGEDG